jgi:amino acid transporter
MEASGTDIEDREVQDREARPEEGGSSEAQAEQGGRQETEKERLDRNLEELLGELRVALPGVQVLFAFLLVVPFNQRFADITSFQRTVYFVTLLFATAACACLIAPTAHHRIEFRRRDKKRIVFGATRLAIIGLTLLALAMTGAVMLVTDFLYGATTVTIAVACVVLLFGYLWYAIPIKRLLDNR